MKIFLVILNLIILKPIHHSKDSVNVRILNHSKYFINQYKLILNGTGFIYQDILPHSYSKYKRLSYIYPSNQGDCTLLVKKVLNHPYSIILRTFPFDHTGENKIEKGSATLILDIKLHNKESDIKTYFKTRIKCLKC